MVQNDFLGDSNLGMKYRLGNPAAPISFRTDETEIFEDFDIGLYENRSRYWAYHFEHPLIDDSKPRVILQFYPSIFK